MRLGAGRIDLPEMHYACEIIFPPHLELKEAVELAMRPFSENNDPSHEDSLPSFWDWYVIGGRYAGSKLTARLGQAAIDDFYHWLVENVMARNFQAGKQELATPEDVAKVDAEWTRRFGQPGPCPLFAHSSDQYHDHFASDVCRVGDLPPELRAYRVIVLKQRWGGTGWAPGFMCAAEHWNGVSLEDSAWDGSVMGALEACKKEQERWRDEYAKTNAITDDWLVATVDYHS